MSSYKYCLTFKISLIKQSTGNPTRLVNLEISGEKKSLEKKKGLMVLKIGLSFVC